MAVFSYKSIKKSFTRQHDQQDCGVACLLSIIRFYGGDSSFERIRQLSGTTNQGTSLLGLYQAANTLDLIAEGCEADPDLLIKHAKPVILHTTSADNFEHFVVCYGFDKSLFIIGDPANGIEKWTHENLTRLWKSKTCLTIEPAANFQSKNNIEKNKRKWLVELINKDIPILAVSLIIGIILSALSLATAVFSQQLLDKILPAKEYPKLIVSLFILGLLFLIQTGLSVIRQKLLLKQSKDFNNRIIGSFYERLLFLPKPFFDSRKIGDMTARLNDTQRIQSFISLMLGNTIISILTITASFVILFIYSWKIALPILISLPIYYLLVYSYNKTIIRHQREVMSAYAQSESNFISTIQGVSTIKNFNKQDTFSSINKIIYGFFQDRIYNLGIVKVSLAWKSGLVGLGITLLIFTLGSILLFNDNLTIGILAATITICSSLLSNIASLALITIPMNEAKVAFDRMYEFVGLQEELVIPEKMDIEKFESLNVSNLSFRFPGTGLVLNEVNIYLQKNELISLAGESGCGKSTLCQILEKFYSFESGDILVNNSISINNINTDSWRNIIGAVPQEIFIFNGTVMDNICLSNTEINIDNFINFCTKYGFDKYINELPQNYRTVIGEEGINLSGGQKQIIAMARALYKNPQLLILDEATAAMDRNTEAFVLNLLLQLKSQLSIIFVSHRLHILPNISDRIYVFHENTIKHSGTHIELMKSANLYSDYWNDLYKCEIQKT
ncbi:MAG: peptidase domain-containing ABC transporter [Prevotellaceae bacterium]|jgi:ATP-binding cassette subfamily B protein|nr:peptidase domain-containing ABC transporter [Prevotellaceae bacterium]